jgi:hypothetical protein
MAETSTYRNTIQSSSPRRREFDRSESYRRVERILEQAGSNGVHRAYFLYNLRWSQAGARISEMNDLGWTIEAVHLPESRWINGIKTKYILRSKPLPTYQPSRADPRQGSLVHSPDWDARETGQERPSSAHTDLGPLFKDSSR